MKFDPTDYTEVRECLKSYHGLKDIDGVFNFFYDETNNARVFRITEEGKFNTSIFDDFVLGGIVYDSSSSISFDQFRESLQLQSSVREIKRRNIAKGDTFLKCMSSNKLEVFLNGLLKGGVYIHYCMLDSLYFSLADIIDSIIGCQNNNIHTTLSDALSSVIQNRNHNRLSNLPEFYISGINWFTSQTVDGFVREVKSVLHKYFRKDINNTSLILKKYGYPDIHKKDVLDFCSELINWIDRINAESSSDAIAIEIIKVLLQNAKKGKLVFLQDNEKDTCIGDYSVFYINNVHTFINSYHIFDTETEIYSIIKDLPFHACGKEMNNYEFQDSTSDIRIQISDVLMGLLGKLSAYANASSKKQLILDKVAMTEQQKTNIKLLKDLILKSSNKNRAFIHYVKNPHDGDKINIILGIDKGLQIG